MEELRTSRDILEDEITRLVKDFECDYGVSVQLNSTYHRHPDARVPQTVRVNVIIEL